MFGNGDLVLVALKEGGSSAHRETVQDRYRRCITAKAFAKKIPAVTGWPGPLHVLNDTTIQVITVYETLVRGGRGLTFLYPQVTMCKYIIINTLGQRVNKILNELTPIQNTVELIPRPDVSFSFCQWVTFNRISTMIS